MILIATTSLHLPVSSLFLSLWTSNHSPEAHRDPTISPHTHSMCTYAQAQIPLFYRKRALWQLHYKANSGQLSVLERLSGILYPQTPFDPPHCSSCHSRAACRYNISWSLNASFKVPLESFSRAKRCFQILSAFLKKSRIIYPPIFSLPFSR